MIYAGPDKSFSTPSALLYRPVRCNLYWAGQVIYCAIRTIFYFLFLIFFDIDRLDVIYTWPDRSFIVPSGLYIYIYILYRPVRCNLYRAGQVNYCVIRTIFFFLYRPVRCNLYRAGQVIYCSIQTFIVGYCKD